MFVKYFMSIYLQNILRVDLRFFLQNKAVKLFTNFRTAKANKPHQAT